MLLHDLIISFIRLQYLSLIYLHFESKTEVYYVGSNNNNRNYQRKQIVRQIMRSK